MSTSASGTTYTSSVSGIATTSGGASNAIGGGREIPTLIFTPAIAGIGTTIANAKRIVPKSNFLILFPPYDLIFLLYPRRLKQKNFH
jgi:hypothetical protein